EELAQAVVLLRIGTGDDPHEGRATAAVLCERQRRLDERRQDRLQLARMPGDGCLQRREPLRAHLVHPATEYFVDQVFLAAEVVVDRGDVDLGPAGDLPQGGPGEPVLREQFLRSAEDAVLGGEGRSEE